MKVGILEEQDKFTWSGGERGEREDEGWDSRRVGWVYLEWWREREDEGWDSRRVGQVYLEWWRERRERR